MFIVVLLSVSGCCHKFILIKPINLISKPKLCVLTADMTVMKFMMKCIKEMSRHLSSAASIIHYFGGLHKIWDLSRP